MTKAKPAKKQVPKRDPIYNPKADATADIAAAVKKAGVERTRVLVMYGGNWCGWCYKLHDLFASDKEIATILLNEYKLVMVDVDTQHNVMDHYVKKSEQHGVPFLTVLDSEGKVLVNQETGALEDGPKHDPKKVKAFLSKWALPAADAEKVLAEGLAEAKRDSKRVLFHVGHPVVRLVPRIRPVSGREREPVRGRLHKPENRRGPHEERRAAHQEVP